MPNFCARIFIVMTTLVVTATAGLAQGTLKNRRIDRGHAASRSAR